MARILVVDDEPDQRFLLKRSLTRAGHEVTEAGDGAAALRAITQAAPDLLVTDMMMPVMGGRGAHQAAARRGGHDGHPEILVTSWDWRQAGCADAVVPKSDSLRRVVEVAEGY